MRYDDEDEQIERMRLQKDLMGRSSGSGSKAKKSHKLLTMLIAMSLFGAYSTQSIMSGRTFDFFVSAIATAGFFSLSYGMIFRNKK